MPSRARNAQLVDGTCVVEAWEYSKVIGKLTINFDENGDVVECIGGQVIPINTEQFTVRDAEPQYNLNISDAEIVAEYLLEFDIFVDYGVDEIMLELLELFTEQVEQISQETIATVPENICRTRGGETNELCPNKDDLSRVGGGVCPLVATFFLLNVPLADFAIQNAG